MSILIKGMKMPTRCEKCDLAYDDDGYFACPFTKAFYKSKQRPSWCPLVELPPHGDLVDRDALMSEIKDFPYGYRGMIANTVTNMPTIIESEE